MKLFVNGTERLIRRTDAHTARFGKMDADYASLVGETGMLQCVVEYPYPVTEAVIRPLRLGVETRVQDNKVEFEIPGEQYESLSVEVNGGIDDALILFVEEQEKMPEDNGHLIAFGPGNHTMDILYITEDNTTVYLAEGAYVTGCIHAENVENLTICGNGILAMEAYERHSPDELLNAIHLIRCRSSVIRNIKIVDSISWSCKITGCDDLEVDHLRIIGNRGNSDGVDVCGSRNVHIHHVFTRIMDDSLVLKAFDTGNVEHILFENCTLWNDFARPIEVGVEIRAEYARDIVYRNIDIIHNLVGYPCMGIHHGDRAEVSDVHFENIRIEDAPGAQLFDIRITDSVWNADKRKGRIHDIFFKDIDVIGKPGLDVLPSPSRVVGFSEETDVRNVTFENIRLLGKEATCPEDFGLLIQDFARNVKVLSRADSEKLDRTDVSVEITKAFVRTEDGRYRGEVTLKAVNNGKNRTASHTWLQINPLNAAEFEDAALEFSLLPGETAEKTYAVSLVPGQYVFSAQSDDPSVVGGWVFARYDLVLGADIEKAAEYPIADAFGERSAGFRFSVDHGMLTVASEALKTHHAVLYTAMPVPVSPGQVLFTVPETDWGGGPAVINGKHGPELAPQLRCPAEITYVFKNEPKVEKINRFGLEIRRHGLVRLPLSLLGIPEGADNFWLEVELEDGERKYPFTLFRSPVPGDIAHMFANVIVKQEAEE